MIVKKWLSTTWWNLNKIDFDKDSLPTERRRTNKFNEYYDVIWKEIENHV